MIKDVSFCITIREDDEDLLLKCVDGITRQGVPDFEILAYGKRRDSRTVRFFGNEEWTEKGEVNKIRNFLCANATKNFVVLMDVNIELCAGWYTAMKHADCFDIVSSRIVTEGHSRAIDWAYQVPLGSKRLPFPLDYDEWTTKAYIWGGLMVVRRATWADIKFDETRREGEQGDVDFCLRASGEGYRLGVFPEAEAKLIGSAGELRRNLTFEESEKEILAFRKFFAAGQEAFNLKDYSGALVNLAKAAETAPDDPEILSLIGWAHYFDGRYAECLAAFVQALEIDPANLDALRGRGWTFLQTRSYESAINDLRRALEFLSINRRNDWLETVRGLSWANYHQGHFDEGIKYFSSLLENSRSDELGLKQDVYRGLGWCYYRKGLRAEAADNFKRAISLDLRTGEMVPDIRRGLELVEAGGTDGVAHCGDDRISIDVESQRVFKKRFLWASVARTFRNWVPAARRTVKRFLEFFQSNR